MPCCLMTAAQAEAELSYICAFASLAIKRPYLVDLVGLRFISWTHAAGQAEPMKTQ